MAELTTCWQCGEERECKPRLRPDHSVEYVCKACAEVQAALDKRDTTRYATRTPHDDTTR